MAGAQGTARVVHPSSNGVTFVEALKATRGRMPDNLEHRRILVLTDGWQSPLIRPAYGNNGAHSKTFLAKAAKGNGIERGKGLRDFEAGWLLEDKEIQTVVNGKEADPYDPANALAGRVKDLRDGEGNHVLGEAKAPFDEKHGVTVIPEPESLMVVPKLAANGEEGIVHAETGLAVEGYSDKSEEKAWNWFPDGELVRSGGRGYSSFYYVYVDGLFYDYDVRRVALFLVGPSVRRGVLELLGLPKELLELAVRVEAVLVKPFAERTAADDEVVRQLVDAVRQQ